MSNNIFEEVYLRQVAGRLSTEYTRAGKQVPDGFDTLQEYAYYKAISGSSERYGLSDLAAFIIVKESSGDYTGMKTSGLIDLVQIASIGFDTNEEFMDWVGMLEQDYGHGTIGLKVDSIHYWAEVYESVGLSE